MSLRYIVSTAVGEVARFSLLGDALKFARAQSKKDSGFTFHVSEETRVKEYRVGFNCNKEVK